MIDLYKQSWEKVSFKNYWRGCLFRIFMWFSIQKIIVINCSRVKRERFLRLVVEKLTVQPDNPDCQLLFLCPERFLLSGKFPMDPDSSAFTHSKDNSITIICESISFLIILYLFLFKSYERVIAWVRKILLCCFVSLVHALYPSSCTEYLVTGMKSVCHETFNRV